MNSLSVTNDERPNQNDTAGTLEAAEGRDWEIKITLHLHLMLQRYGVYFRTSSQALVSLKGWERAG